MDELAQELSDQQRVCLRLVGRGMSSKEIAKETGLTHQTVDTYVTKAMSLLGVTNRREAARILASAELSEKLGSQPPVVAEPIELPQQEAVAGGWPGGSTILPPVGGRLNDQSSTARTYAVLRVAVVSAATLIAIALLLAGALRALR